MKGRGRVNEVDDVGRVRIDQCGRDVGAQETAGSLKGDESVKAGELSGRHARACSRRLREQRRARQQPTLVHSWYFETGATKSKMAPARSIRQSVTIPATLAADVRRVQGAARDDEPGIGGFGGTRSA